MNEAHLADRPTATQAEAASPGPDDDRPVVLVTGASGSIGAALVEALPEFWTIGLDIDTDDGNSDEEFSLDLTSEESIREALEQIAAKHGRKLAAVVHLAAYYDFSGEEKDAYHAINEEGTKRFLKALQDFDVGRFIYSGTMLVHEAKAPGERIDEETPLDPGWAYPQSKARTEEVISAHRGDIPVTRLHIAGLYDEMTCVPTLSHQIARIYDRGIKSHAYSGDLQAGQAFVHRDDLIDAFRRVIDRRERLPDDHALLIGEREAVSYERLQETLGQLIHGEETWTTLRAPAPVAKGAAALEEKLEPVIPDEIDRGEKPFIRPFMIDLANDHYALNIDKAAGLLDWRPKHFILDTLPELVRNLKNDPSAWYKANGITPPRWLEAARERGADAGAIKTAYDEKRAEQSELFRWAPWFTLLAASWLVTAPAILDYDSTGLAVSDVLCGLLLVPLAFLSMIPRLGIVRWAVAGVGTWIMFSPLVFWTESASAYLSDTLIGALIFGFAVLVRPSPGVSPIAAETGPRTPPGWSFNPSEWLQRLPIIILAIVGFHISRYLTAYQLGHIDSVWEPFFAGSPTDPQNGTEEIITSSVSEAWPVPDAGIGALTYMLEILTGVVGSTKRWRTMPWLVLLFGMMIVPLGVVSITFIIIQPIVIGTWCTLCLIAAAAMLIQIPYSLDELVATSEFLVRRKRQGASLLRTIFTGDTDDGDTEEPKREFDRAPGAIVADMVGGGITLPWNLVASIAIGLWLMFTRLTFGTEGGMANWDHLVGALVVTNTVIALAESGRILRFLNIVFGAALFVTPFVYGADLLHALSSLLAGGLLIFLSFRRGPVRNSYGEWTKFIR